MDEKCPIPSPAEKVNFHLSSAFRPTLGAQSFSSMYFVTCICSKIFGATWVSETLLPQWKPYFICPFCSSEWLNILETFPHKSHFLLPTIGIHLNLSQRIPPPSNDGDSMFLQNTGTKTSQHAV